MPKVSVIIPTYDRCQLVQLAIDSVLAQTYTDYELIVVDDGSTDGTGEALASRYGDRIRYVWQENQGESVARQHGVDTSQAPLLAFLDSDDLWLPDKLEKQVVFLDRHPEVAYVYCWASVIDKDGDPVNWPVLGSQHNPATFSLKQLLLGNFIVSPSTLLLRRAAYDACGGFNPRIQFAEDWDLYLRLGIAHRFGCVCEPLVQVRLYERGWHKRREDLARMLRDHLLLIETFYANPKVTNSPLIQVKAQALANRYGNAGFAYLACGEDEEGQRCLARACELAPESWAGPDGFMQAAANYAVSLLGPNHPVERAEVFIDRVVHYLPPVLPEGIVTRSRLLGWLYVTLAHHRWHLSDSGGVLPFVLRAMWLDRAWRKKRGLWSLFVRSLLHQFGVRTERQRDTSHQATWVISLAVAADGLSAPIEDGVST